MEINIGNLSFSNEKDFILIGGINVLENYDSSLYAAERYVDVCSET